MKKLHLGCGHNYLDGYVNCDISSNVKVDLKFDLNEVPFPFENDFADEIFMDNVLEHLDDIPKTMEEIHRILKVGGIARIIVPYAHADAAFQDPTHKHFFTEKTMDYFTAVHPFNFYTNIRFKKNKAELVSCRETLHCKLRNLIPFRRILRYFLNNMYNSVYFELEKIAK